MTARGMMTADTPYIIVWDPRKEGPDFVRKALREAFLKASKRVVVRVIADDISYMEQLREILSEFIAQTIIVERIRGSGE